MTLPENEANHYSPWDDRSNLGFFKAFINTWMKTVFSPVQFFSKMPRQGGYGGPLLYGFLVGELGMLFALLWQGTSMFLPSFIDYAPGEYIGSQIAGMTFLFFLSPILVIAGLFVSTAFLHLCLLLVGVAGKGFETTFRVVCFSSSTFLIGLIPFCGGMIGGIWNLIVQIIGFREAHEISTLRAVFAVLLPVIVCCGLFSILFMAYVSAFHGAY